MGKYSKISCKTLKEAATDALNELNTYKLNDVKSSLNSSGVLPNEIRKNVNNTIEKIEDNDSINGTVGLLKYNLNKLVEVLTKVEKYQKKEEEYKTYLKKVADTPNNKKKLKDMKEKLEKYEESITELLDKKRTDLL